jgi:GNAT superfamily N-acetyltransferase
MRTLLDAWVDGWTISRNTPEPVKIPTGYRIDVGLPGHRVRYVLPKYEAAVVDRQHEPDTWLIICDHVTLDPPWRAVPTEYLMTTALRASPIALDSPYRLETIQSGSLVKAQVRAADGTTAAHGKAAVTGDTAVFDQIETDPQHRRRGLGRTIMAALSVAARSEGAATGVLVATEDGRALYTALGWTVSSAITAAVSRG